jgi:hypothetical protein
VHSSEKEFSRGGGNPRSLQLEDFFMMAPKLDAHVFNFRFDLIEVCHRCAN